MQRVPCQAPPVNLRCPIVGVKNSQALTGTVANLKCASISLQLSHHVPSLMLVSIGKLWGLSIHQALSACGAIKSEFHLGSPGSWFLDPPGQKNHLAQHDSAVAAACLSLNQQKEALPSWGWDNWAFLTLSDLSGRHCPENWKRQTSVGLRTQANTGSCAGHNPNSFSMSSKVVRWSFPWSSRKCRLKLSSSMWSLKPKTQRQNGVTHYTAHAPTITKHTHRFELGFKTCTECPATPFTHCQPSVPSRWAG